jgi:hypothetical protein
MKRTQYLFLTVAFSLAGCGLDDAVVIQDPDQPDPTMPGRPRVTEGLQAVFFFDEGNGAQVSDRSNVGLPVVMTVENPEAIQWLPGGGLEILSPTIITTAEPPTKLVEGCQAANEITLEAWVAPANTNQDGPARILTYSNGNDNINFTLGQTETKAEVRLRTSATNGDGTPAAISELSAFPNINTHHIVYTRTGLQDIANIYVDSQSAGQFEVAGTFENWERGYTLSVGNEVGGQRPWRGKIFLAAVYCRALGPEEVFQNFEAGF